MNAVERSESAAAQSSIDGGLRAARDKDKALSTARVAPFPDDYLKRTHSLYSSEVLCEVVLLGEEREQIEAQLNWTPRHGDSDDEFEGGEQEHSGEDDWLPSNKGRPTHMHVRGAPDAETEQMDAPSPSEPIPDLMAWLQCVMHVSSPGRLWGCWCGTQPYAPFRVVRRHIRQAHGGIIDPPSPVAAASHGHDSSDLLAEDACVPSALQQPIAMRSNVRVQLPPPLELKGRRVRTQ